MAAKTLPACPVETTLTLISDKWKVLILRDLLPGTKRFGFGNPVGTVWIACAGPGGVESVLCRFQGNREEIREAACCRALELVLETLNGLET